MVRLHAYHVIRFEKPFFNLYFPPRVVWLKDWYHQFIYSRACYLNAKWMSFFISISYFGFSLTNTLYTFLFLFLDTMLLLACEHQSMWRLGNTLWMQFIINGGVFLCQIWHVGSLSNVGMFSIYSLQKLHFLFCLPCFGENESEFNSSIEEV